MANFQTLTEINDLIQQIDILKKEKEELRNELKNAKLNSAQGLWKHEQTIRFLNSQRRKSTGHKQGLLLFNQEEENFLSKLKQDYKPQIEKLLPQILQEISTKIIQKHQKDFEKNYQIICSPKFIYLLPADLAENIQKPPKNTKKDFLQFTFVNKIYLLEAESLVDILLKKIITKKLPQIAQIKLITEKAENEKITQNPENQTDQTEENGIDELENLEAKSKLGKNEENSLLETEKNWENDLVSTEKEEIMSEK